jgi:hypothetical protein
MRKEFHEHYKSLNALACCDIKSIYLSDAYTIKIRSYIHCYDQDLAAYISFRRISKYLFVQPLSLYKVSADMALHPSVLSSHAKSF